MTSSKSTATGGNGLATRVAAVYLYVSDVDRSIAFYRDLLGIPLEKDDRDPDWAEATLPGGMRFAMHRSHPGAEPQTPGSIIVDFETRDVDAAAARLRAAGVRLGELLRERWGSTLTVYDPDGYRVSLYQPPGRATPRATG